MADQNGEMKKPATGIGRGVNIGGGSAVAGPSTNISARLPSFRAPRDLTLSASASAPTVKATLMARPRKSFCPNIPVRREKNEKILESRSDKAPKRSRERDKKEGGRGRGRGSKEFVQTTGSLFGEGIAANLQRRGGGYMYGGGGGGGGGGGAGRGADAGFMNKPVLNLDTVNHIDKEHEDQRLKEILRDDFIDDLDEVIGRDGSGELLPVQLPMVDTGRGFKEEDQEDVKDKKIIPPPPSAGNSVEIKKEPEDDDATMTPDMKDIAQETKNIKLMDMKMPMKGGLPKKEKPPELSVAQLLTGRHEDFMFFQLPNSLPSLPPEIKQEPNITRSANQASNNTASDDDDDEEKKTQSEYCTLNSLPEGQIGTLKIYKSGKTEIWFGEHRLSVNKGTQVGFLQDVVKVDIDEESKTGSMTVLGHIGHRLVCSPDLEALVKHKKS